MVASSPERVADVCSAECRRLVEENFDVTWNSGAEWSSAAMASALSEAEVLLTSWGSPSLTERMIDDNPQLRIIGHAAGTVKKLLPRTAFNRLDGVFSAAPRIADSVGEYCLSATLTLLRRLPAFDAELRGGGWRCKGLRGHELTGRRVGIVSASSTARAFIRYLAPFETRIQIFDPYLAPDEATELGAELASLEQVLANDIVSLHLPAIPETEGMITARHLALVPDDGILINSSRASTVDTDALYTELASGRFSAALDVYETEPPKLWSEIVAAPNVLLTPHIAGDTVEGHLALMEFVVRDIIDWIDTGRRGRAFVDGAAWDRTA